MTGKKFALLSVIALLGGAAIFGIPNSVWWDSGSWIPRTVLGIGIAAWVYVVYQLVKGMKQ